MSYLLYSQAEQLKLKEPVPVTLHPAAVYHGDGIYKLIKARAQKAGIKHFSPHDFRRTFCTDLLESGEDVLTVQELAGHCSPATTAKYDKRGEGRKRRAVRHLKFK